MRSLKRRAAKPRVRCGAAHLAPGAGAEDLFVRRAPRAARRVDEALETRSATNRCARTPGSKSAPASASGSACTLHRRRCGRRAAASADRPGPACRTRSPWRCRSSRHRCSRSTQRGERALFAVVASGSPRAGLGVCRKANATGRARRGVERQPAALDARGALASVASQLLRRRGSAPRGEGQLAARDRVARGCAQRRPQLARARAPERDRVVEVDDRRASGHQSGR